MSTMKSSKWSINTQILLGAVLGILAGAYAHHLGQQSSLVQNGVYLASMVGGVFIDLLKMLLVPLVFCSITVGIANLSQHQQAQRVWQSTLIFFFATMAIAIVIGMTGMHLF
ncbi:MAG: cation:dicarboxylate symporter family transporter, partial [Methylophilaceae bacterium]